MMLRHVAMFKWHDETTDAQLAMLRDALARLPEQVSAIRRATFGEDAGLRAGNHDFVLVVDFDDEAAFLAYLEHPAHKAVAQDCIEPMRAESTRVQFHVDD